MRDHIGKECTDDKLIDRLTLYNYNDRLVERKTNQHVENAVLFDFVESSLKGIEDYIKAFQIVHN